MNRILTRYAKLAAAAFFAAALAYSQTNTAFRFDVPFAFTVGERHLQAGLYTVRFDGNNILLDCKGGDAIYLPPALREVAASPAPQAALHFHRYGNHNYLRAVQREGSDRREWGPSRAEKESARAATHSVIALVRK